MTRSESLLEKVVEQLSDLNEKMGRQEARLEEHIRRTAIAENNIDKIADTIRPIQAHVAMVQGGVKTLSWIGAVVAFIIATGVAIWKLFK